MSNTRELLAKQLRAVLAKARRLLKTPGYSGAELLRAQEQAAELRAEIARLKACGL